MITDLYIIKFNENYSVTKNDIGVFKDDIIVEPYFKLDDATNRIKELIKESFIGEYEFKNNCVLSEIVHYLVGEPYNEYTKALQPYFPITMYTDHEGNIVKYKANNTPLNWSSNDMYQYNSKYNIGDIVDVICDGIYKYKAVILSKPVSITEYCIKTNPDKVWYFGGYICYGHNPFERDKNGNRIVTWHKELYGEFDDTIYETSNTIDMEFFEGLSIYAKYCDSMKDCNIAEEIEDLYNVDILYTLYFDLGDYKAFNDRINMMKEYLK